MDASNLRKLLRLLLSERGHSILVTIPQRGATLPDTPRTARLSLGSVCYHVNNRGHARMKVFQKPQDFEAFVGLIAKPERVPARVVGCYRMPNYFCPGGGVRRVARAWNPRSAHVPGRARRRKSGKGNGKSRMSAFLVRPAG